MKFRNVIIMMMVLMMTMLSCSFTSNSSSVVETQLDNATILNNNKTLVAYFSATGTTKRVAEKIAELENADIYEIVPANPYSSADLNWHDNNSRTTKEMNDKNARPEIASKDVIVSNYDTIYLGYPIWWGDAPRIINTFVEKYNFDGINIIPFCTSGSSGIEKSRTSLINLAKTGNWAKGERFNGGADINSIQNFINNNKVNMQKLKLFVDDVELDVTWKDNASVNQIKELAKQNPIIINAHQYGGFEQVGEIGHNIVSNNVQMTTEAGDIVLYAGSNIVVFYGSNSWSYTKLGKINKTKEELKNMLDKSSVIFKISH